MAGINTNGELAKMLVDEVQLYAAAGIEESVRRNSHMNMVSRSNQFDRFSAEAAVVDFCNFIMARRGLDLGLYTKDLHDKPEAV